MNLQYQKHQQITLQLIVQSMLIGIIQSIQTAAATGPGGVNDYSRFTFTYIDKYYLITNGIIDLASILSCVGDDS